MHVNNSALTCHVWRYLAFLGELDTTTKLGNTIFRQSKVTKVRNIVPSWVVKATVCICLWELMFFSHYFNMAEKFKYGSTHYPMRRRQSVCWGTANSNHIFYYYRENCLSFSAQGHLKRHPQLFNSILCPAWFGSLDCYTYRSTITETSWAILSLFVFNLYL